MLFQTKLAPGVQVYTHTPSMAWAAGVHPGDVTPISVRTADAANQLRNHMHLSERGMTGSGLETVTTLTMLSLHALITPSKAWAQAFAADCPPTILQSKEQPHSKLALH
jgi:hypothetical protein